ncbi:hypothetical protein ND748_03250 [Frankia sp. AiPs1]|uniref:pPIWI_RE_Z domain-containing protein n=1 Tax=Frankia sp. AiPs1 TaxID=573493 RepID=UPI002042FE8D|nr:hypothetical protein [Frankia sp. AiPs1]MCM3920693.1 hypothetical protein [Frankia sp. AiPs1]
MRESGHWRTNLAKGLTGAGLPSTGLPAGALCQVELGLYFLTRNFPDEPIGVLPPILSGYVAVPDDLVPVVRRLRHRMGDVARRGYWRTLLNQYVRVPDRFRAFDRTDDPARRVNDQTIFVPRATSVCTGRDEVYANALAEPLAYVSVSAAPPAQAGVRYTFLAGDVTQYVQMPNHLPAPLPLAQLPATTSRRRSPWTVSLTEDLASTAAQVDEQLAGRPDVTNRNFTKRLTDIRLSTVDPAAGTLADRSEEFTLDGVSHIVGLMNSGKTTLMDLLTINRVTEHGNRVCLVVSSVGDVLAKVSFLRTLGLDAVPLIGERSRGEHAARYWRSMIDEAATFVPDDYNSPDPAAAYANTSCLLEPFRWQPSPRWEPLQTHEFPCQGRLREAEGESRTAYDCPLLSVCPTRKALREVATAQIWVTTPQCLVATKAAPATAAMRWFEQLQHTMDLVIFDEADAVQEVLDGRFVQHEQLVAGQDGWSHRMVAHTNNALATRAMAPATDPQVQRWFELVQIHNQAVFTLHRIALSDSGERLKALLNDAPFTAHSLFRRVARTLHGLPTRGEGDSQTEHAAEDFYQGQMQEFAESPLETRDHPLRPAADTITQLVRDESAVEAAFDAWIDDHTPSTVDGARIAREQPLLRLVLEAAIWAARITTTFFEMVTLYPSVREQLSLPDEERFWLDQPPRDYRPLVPEAPMGNILALRWVPQRDGGASLQLLWVHGIGRWLLHHAHDLLASEGIDGPHVILTSATSWTPGSSFFHIPITPTAALRQPEEDREALLTSTLAVRPSHTAGGGPIYVSGRLGTERHDGLRRLVTALCEPGGGRHRSVVDELRAQLPADRQRLLFVVLSGEEAKVAAAHINSRGRYTARNVVPDASDLGMAGIARRSVGDFGKGTSDILVAAEMAIQRGYNVLNTNNTAALGAVIYLTRSHPPPMELRFPLSLVAELAMRHLAQPATAPPGQLAATARELRNQARATWYDVIGRPMAFRTLEDRFRPAFVANSLVPMSQTIGRSIRGNQPTKVLLCDAAFAERLARQDPAADTPRTSVVVATDVLLTTLLTPPAGPSTPSDQLVHAVNEAVWGLLGHMFHSNDPLGSQRGTNCAC